jgi:predicted MPP superfamily phosphohydrolase
MPSWKQGDPVLKAWPFLGIFLIQVLLCLAHWLVYSTWIAFHPGLSPAGILELRAAMLVLTFSFVSATLPGFSFYNFPVTLAYKLAAAWLGFFNYFFWAACLSWPAWYAACALSPYTHLAITRPAIAGGLFALTLLTGIYGLLNARWIRVRRIAVSLPNLPASWRGRRAVLLSDMHLGHVNGERFCRRMATMTNALRPDIVFLPGDIFDGTKVDMERMIAPFKKVVPPFGVYFSSGNHEEIHNAAGYLDAIAGAGIRVLANERVTVDGLHVAGIPYADTTYPIRVKATLEGMHIERSEATILLNHAPTRLPIVEEAGVSLQLSGHTHGGQIFPFTWFTRRIFGRFTSGLHHFGALHVYTSTGCGTWGPPMRIGSQPEIVVFTFE